MKDEGKTRAQLIEELGQLRARVEELEQERARDLNEREQAERDLRESEATLGSVLDNSSTVIFIKDLEGRYLLVNRRYEEVFHVTREEITGKTDFDLFPAEAAERFKEGDRHALRRGHTEQEELIAHGDEVSTYVSVKFPLRDTGGEPFAVCGIATDITARKRAEQALQRAHDELQRRVDERTHDFRAEKAFSDMALNALPGLFYVFNREGEMIRWNQRFEQLTGYDEQEVRRRHVTEYFEDQDLERVRQIITETFEWGESAAEVDVVRKDGDRLPCYFTGTRAEIDGEQYVVGMGIDISERKRAEAALEHSEQLFRNLTESIGAMIFIVSVDDDQVFYANPAAVKGTGYTLEELTAVPPPQVLTPESQAVINDVRAAFLRGQDPPRSMELEFVAKSGERRWFESTGSVFMTEQGLVKVTACFDITDRKRTEQALRESERRFRALANGTPAGIGITQGERFLYANKAVLQRYGVSWEEFQQIPPHDVLSEPAHAAGHQALEQAMARGEDKARFEYQEPDGTWFEVNAVSTEIDGQEAMIWTSFDISDRMEAKQALEESERRFRSLAEASTAHISIMQDDKYVYANQAFLDYYGLEPDELELISMEDMMMGIMGPDVGKQAMPAYEEAIATGAKSFTFEWQDLQDHWYHATASEMELDGRPAYMLMNVDITEVKKVQERLEESEKRYRTIFDTAGTGMISFGEDKVITLANEELYKLTGFSPEEVVGKMTWEEFFSEASLEKMREFHSRRSEEPATVPRAYEAQLVDRTGVVHDGVINIQLVPGTQQRVASFHDMTDVKRAQQQMYRADKMAALGQIIAGVAHEINNPNNFIYFNLPILRRYVEAMQPLLERALADEPELTILNMPYRDFLEDMFKLLQNMEHGSKRITSIVSDLKTYIRSGEDMEMRVGPLAPVIDQVMTLIGKQVRKMVRRFETEVADGLPPVKVNPGKLEQVLINLVINAGQAADKEDSWIKLSAGPAEDGRWVEVRVEDNGAGIPKEQLDQIFEPFYTSKGREEGTGLGLSISHQIVQDHGGELTVRSEVGQGSCFIVRLPAAADDE